MKRNAFAAKGTFSTYSPPINNIPNIMHANIFFHKSGFPGSFTNITNTASPASGIRNNLFLILSVYPAASIPVQNMAIPVMGFASSTI